MIDESLSVRLCRIVATIFPVQGCQEKQQMAKDAQAIRYRRYVDQLERLPAELQEDQVKEWEARYNVIK